LPPAAQGALADPLRTPGLLSSTPRVLHIFRFGGAEVTSTAEVASRRGRKMASWAFVALAALASMRPAGGLLAAVRRLHV